VFNRCLVSVSNKEKLNVLAEGLSRVSPDCEVLSTGGTAEALRKLSLQPREISDFTGFPECFEGRLKTLHPLVHGGILFRRGQDDNDAESRGIKPIDLVVVNLYPFEETYLCGSDNLVEMIDIGGPTLLRAAAKNSESVVVLCDPADYEECMERAANNTLDLSYRHHLRAKVFAHTAAYDAKIAATLAEESYPETVTVSFKRISNLRYGENPHQSGAVYKQDFWKSGLANYQLHHGKELSYNNLLDGAAAVLPLRACDRNTCCVVKHAAPCGLAEAEDNVEAFERAWAGDPVSAFGSVVGFSHSVKEAEAELLRKKFVEVVIAPRFSGPALEILKQKPALRIVTLDRREGRRPSIFSRNLVMQEGLALFQDPDRAHDFQFQRVAESSNCAPSEGLLRFGLTVVRCLKSNAVGLVRQVGNTYQTIGLGGGQPNRVQALQIALGRAREHFGDEAIKESLLVSDAFFPFPDSIEAAAAAGVPAIVAPGGSKKDPEVTEAAQRLGVDLTFVNHRLFRH